MLFFYRLFFPIIFIFFIPSIIIKLIRRTGYKKTFMERFGIFSKERKKIVKESWQNAIWIHAVSVGETNLALTTIKRWNEENPNRKFILSTTTTTAQEIARNKSPENVFVIFCPIDSFFAVRRVLNLFQPLALVIFETELWPNMIAMCVQRGIKLALVNCRISDKSFSGYKKIHCFFAPLLDCFDIICAQTSLDKERLLCINRNIAKNIEVLGNIKFDQNPPSNMYFDFIPYFGEKKHTILLAASTHNQEESLIINVWKKLFKSHPDVKLVIVPRHAERGTEIEKQIRNAGFTCFRKSNGIGDACPVDCLLADTTGELAKIIAGSDLILMGKTFAGNHEGQNIIEPAIMGKAIICGPELTNFRQALDVLLKQNAVYRIQNDSELSSAVETLLNDRELRFQYGERAKNTMMKNQGALQSTIAILEKIIS